MGAKAVIPSGDEEAMKEAAGERTKAPLTADAKMRLFTDCWGEQRTMVTSAESLLHIAATCLSSCLRSKQLCYVLNTAGTLHGIIDTVSAKHDVEALTKLLAPRGKLVMVGLPVEKPTIDHFDMVLR